MIDRTDYPAGVPCWIDLELDDPAAGAAFYVPLFGWELEDQLPADVPGHYLVGTIRGKSVAAIGSRGQGAPAEPRWRTYVRVDSADLAAQRARELGGSVLVEPTDVGDAGRMAVIADPEGAQTGAWEPRRRGGAEVVNEAGSWNFSGLHTRDPEAALAFYAGVYGWDGGTPDPQMGGAVLLRRAGYGDHLEQLMPGMRERMEQMGAPERFEDAVGWLVPLQDGESPNWDVTFGVDDADATASRAQELGGTVLMPPTDMPWVRTTVIRDPQGTVFTASKFVPPDVG